MGPGNKFAEKAVSEEEVCDRWRQCMQLIGEADRIHGKSIFNEITGRTKAVHYEDFAEVPLSMFYVAVLL